MLVFERGFVPVRVERSRRGRMIACPRHPHRRLRGLSGTSLDHLCGCLLYPLLHSIGSGVTTYCTSKMGFLAFSGRLMLASVFLMSGAMKLMMHEQGPANPILQYMTPKMDGALNTVTSYTGVRLPIEQEQYATIVFVAGGLELLGGLLFALNVKLGAILLMGVLLPTSLVMHDFWNFAPSSPAHQIEFSHFIKNVSMFGAFLMFAATPRSGALQAKLKLN